jgi:hypothetical protein
LFAYAPLFIQGVLLKSPMEVGIAMLSLSLGWSMGSLMLGQVIHRFEKKNIGGGRCTVFLGTGAGSNTFIFSSKPPWLFAFGVFSLPGLVWALCDTDDTSGGAKQLKNRKISVLQRLHISLQEHWGALWASGFAEVCSQLAWLGKWINFPRIILRKSCSQENISHQIENIFNPEMLSNFSETALEALRTAALSGLSLVFWIIFGISIICFGCCLFTSEKLDHC